MQIRNTFFQYHVSGTAVPRRHYNASETATGEQGWAYCPYFTIHRGVVSFFTGSSKLVLVVEHGRITYRDIGFWRYA